MNWWKARLNALLDNVLWVLVLAVIAAVGGSLVAFGGRRADLPVWLVVLFGAVLAACVVAIGVIFIRVKGMATASGGAAGAALELGAPNPHAGLRRRIDALAGTLGERNEAAEWVAADTFNGILRDAREATRDPLLEGIAELERGEDGWETLAHSATNGTISTLLAQIRAVLD